MAVTNVYVDGFNVYHGLTEVVARDASPPPSWKWLDLVALSQRLAPADEIQRVRYFTARVKAPHHDSQLAQRQQAYLRALATSPGLTVHLGQFMVNKRRMPLADSLAGWRMAVMRALGLNVKKHPDGKYSVSVLRTEEKGSDVNLATYLLLDAFRKDFGRAVVISNDTDLCEPIRIVVDELHIPVTVVNPRGYMKPAAKLQKVATETRLLRIAAVASCQFPTTLHDARGTITKPPGW